MTKKGVPRPNLRRVDYGFMFRTQFPGGAIERKKQCEALLGQKLQSTATYEGDPYMVLCYLLLPDKYNFKGAYNIDLVDLKRGMFREYMRDGKMIEDIQWFKWG